MTIFFSFFQRNTSESGINNNPQKNDVKPQPWESSELFEVVDEDDCCARFTEGVCRYSDSISARTESSISNS
jgi:hypothetical protein